MHFYSATSGFAVASDGDLWRGGELLTTSDGGDSWTPRPAPSGVQSVCIDRSGHGWLGAMGTIYSTTDGGEHWAKSFSLPRDRHHRMVTWRVFRRVQRRERQ